MAERSIFVLDSRLPPKYSERQRRSPGITDVENEFLSSQRETLSHTEIHEVAKRIGAEILELVGYYRYRNDFEGTSTISKTSMILHILQTDRLFEYISLMYGDESSPEPVLSPTELHDAVTPLRQAILREIEAMLPNDINALLVRATLREREPNGYTSIDELEEGTVLKRGQTTGPNFIHGMRKYLRLQQQGIGSKYIAFHVHDIEYLRGSEDYGAILGKFSQCVTLLEAIQKEHHRISFVHAVRYLVDAMHGSAFLVAYDLILSDNSLDNIRIDIEQNIGQLFDFDGLKPKGETGYLSKFEYFPPEARRYVPSEYRTHDGQESGVVYEFGIGLGILVKHYELDQDNAIAKVAGRMINPSPEQRPTLQEAIAELEEILSNCE